jgi:predicted PurR-regulated permease PerM
MRTLGRQLKVGLASRLGLTDPPPRPSPRYSAVEKVSRNALAELVARAKTISENFTFITADRVKSALQSISLSGLVGGTLNSFFTIVGYTSITLLFLMYFLPAFPRMSDKIKRAFPDKRGAILCRAMNSIGSQVQSYIWAKSVTSVITGAGVTIPCLLFGVDFAVTWGVFAALLNFVPNIGAVLSIIPPVLVCALQPDLGGTAPLWLAGVLVIMMGLTGNVMEPLILGQSVNLSPTASLLALFIWGFLWGTVGMLIAVPAMAMVKFTCDNIEGLKPIGVMLGN